jgi:hypothetical protein
MVSLCSEFLGKHASPSGKARVIEGTTPQFVFVTKIFDETLYSRDSLSAASFLVGPCTR